MNQPLIYLAGPIRGAPGSDPLENIRFGMQKGLDLMEAGYAVIMPQLSQYTEEIRSLPWELWMGMDYTIISRCDALYRLPGPSRGADDEVTFAQTQGIPVVYSDRELAALFKSNWRKGRETWPSREQALQGAPQRRIRSKIQGRDESSTQEHDGTWQQGKADTTLSPEKLRKQLPLYMRLGLGSTATTTGDGESPSRPSSTLRKGI